jgi:cysteine desulfurase
MASAYEINISANNSNIERMRQLRDRITTGVLDEIPHSKLTGHPQLRLPNHASFIFERLDANILLMLLDQAGFCCSSGSACKSGNLKPSEILNSIGVSPDWALGSLRVTLGRSNTEEDVERFLVSLPGLVERGRLLS